MKKKFGAYKEKFGNPRRNFLATKMKTSNEVVINKIYPLLKARCRSCKKEQIISAKTYDAPCRNCGANTNLDVESTEPIDSYAALVLRKFYVFNEVILSSPPWNRIDVALVARMFKQSNLGIEVGKGEMGLKPYHKKRCMRCGMCNDCKKSFLEVQYSKENLRMCPSCSSVNISMTTTQNKVCDGCGSEEVREIKKIRIYRLSLKKMRMFWNDGR